MVFLVAATIIAGVIIGVFSARGGRTSAVENAAGTMVSPPQGVFAGVGNFFGRISSYFGDINTLKQENEWLRDENTNLQKQIRDMEGMERENGNLRAMLKLKERQTKIDMLAASISAKDPSNWYSTFTINRGTGDGVARNQAVVNANRELVGQVLRVGENWAEVITILDSQSSVGVSIKRSKTTGIVEGDGSLRYEGKCRLGYIARDADIQTGDFVETSGLGGIFPKGLLIGTVTEIYDENSTMSKAATIEPSADIASLNEVFVITSYKESDLSESDDRTSDDSSNDNDNDNDRDNDRDNNRDSNRDNDRDSDRDNGSSSQDNRGDRD